MFGRELVNEVSNKSQNEAADRRWLKLGEHFRYLLSNKTETDLKYHK